MSIDKRHLYWVLHSALIGYPSAIMTGQKYIIPFDSQPTNSMLKVKNNHQIINTKIYPAASAV